MTTQKSRERAEVEALIAREYPGLRLLILRRTGNPALGNDLLNEAICTSWEKWQAGQIQRPDQIAGYVFQVAMNLLRNHRRKSNERPDLRGDTDAVERLAAPEGADLATESLISAKVRTLLQELSPRDRVVIKRFYLDEADKETVCRECGGISSLQFDKIVFRARNRLRKLFEAAGLRKSDFFVLAIA